MSRHHSVLGRTLGFVAFLLLSLSAIAVGLLAFDVHVLNLPFVQAHLSSLIRPLYIVIGVAGLLGLLLAIFGCSTGMCVCNHGHHESRRD